MADRLPDYDLSRLRVLLVEPNEFMRRVLVSTLRSLNIQNLASAGSARAGWNRLLDEGADLVLCDWSPEFDGLSFVHRIRQDPESPDRFMAILMLSAYSAREDVIIARDHGVSSFLAKPVSVRMIYRRIVQIIERHVPYVKTKTYFGPDRRHKVIEIPPEEDRRRPAPERGLPPETTKKFKHASTGVPLG